MNTELKVGDFISRIDEIPVIDVRTPAEFEQGHVPGAFNIPLFSNEERALVGTKYTKEGRYQSILLSLELVGKKLQEFVKTAKSLAKNDELLVHCWRGGMRSQSMAWLLNFAGIKSFTLKGGYKAYRNYLHACFEKKVNLVVLGGLTGSGKTTILRSLANDGHQVIDLEAIANHKGSVFGSIGMGNQPTNEQFENNLFENWRKLDFDKPVWIEDESRAIGSVTIPEPLFRQILDAPAIVIEIDRETRIENLVREYGGTNPEIVQQLKDSVMKITRRIGGLNTKLYLAALEENDLKKAAGFILDYYDKTYRHALSNRNPGKVFTFKPTNQKVFINREIIEFYNLNFIK